MYYSEGGSASWMNASPFGNAPKRSLIRRKHPLKMRNLLAINGSMSALLDRYLPIQRKAVKKERAFLSQFVGQFPSIRHFLWRKSASQALR